MNTLNFLAILTQNVKLASYITEASKNIVLIYPNACAIQLCLRLKISQNQKKETD